MLPGFGAQPLVKDLTKQFLRAFPGMAIDKAYAEYLANTNLSTAIPVDDTIPQITEGTQILSVTIRPKSVRSRIRLRFQGEFSLDTVTQNGVAALFVVGTSNALRATVKTVAAANYVESLVLEHEYAPGVLTPLVFTIRVGPASSGNMRMNGTASGRYFGGVSGATLTAEEFAS